MFQGWLEKEEQNKNKGFLKKSKYWKKYFCVLRRYDGDENVYFQWFEREEDWRKEFPKGSFSLFPKYWVFKHKQEKGKNMFEISNDDEAHYLMAVNEKTMDLWVIQFMMQTRLSASMAGKIADEVNQKKKRYTFWDAFPNKIDKAPNFHISRPCTDCRVYLPPKVKVRYFEKLSDKEST